MWGASSVGRAQRSQRWGRGFKSPALHQTSLCLRNPVVGEHNSKGWFDETGEGKFFAMILNNFSKHY